VLRAIEAPDKAITEILESGAAPVLSTRFRRSEGSHAFIYHVVTASAAGRHAQLILHGFESNLKHTESLEQHILKGLRFRGKSEPSFEHLEDGTYVNHLMGFRLMPPGRGWTILDRTPAALRSVGAVVQFARRGTKRGGSAGAVYADIDAEELITTILENSVGLKAMKLERVSETSVRWLGQPAKQCLYRAVSGAVTLEFTFTLASIGGTHYFLVDVSEKGGKEGASFLDLFRLIR
jgi:hypothetical protein